MTIEDLLEYLDGRGIIYADQDLVCEALTQIGLDLFDELEERQ
uniref:Uncharacterized protein n=1 Tax=viral metagenome TaxID=1070528 RepID=A0A6M3LEZ2_9ZZZZ